MMGLYRLEGGSWVFTTRRFGGLIHFGHWSLWRLLMRIPRGVILHIRALREVEKSRLV